MERLPEAGHAILSSLMDDLKSRGSISAVGLFGSWSRGDAVWSSDVDLLIVDRRDFDHEYIERAEIEDYFLDLDYIPKKWVQKQFPVDIDQKLYEAVGLYDPSRTLAKAKDFILSIYSKPERVEMRMSGYLMEAETYLSRGISALNKGDFQSAKVNAAIGLEAILKIFIEVNRMPFSNSRFVRILESSTERFGVGKLFTEYIEIAGLSELDRQKTEQMMGSFLDMWKKAVSFIEANSSTVETLHVKVMNDLNYYGKESFLKGMAIRTGSLVSDGLFVEAAHYMLRTAVSMLENYAWLISILEKKRFDFTVLFQRLKGSEISPDEICQRAVETFGIEDISGREAEESLRRAKEIIIRLRRKGRELVANLPS